jgi:hypothetical protein
VLEIDHAEIYSRRIGLVASDSGAYGLRVRGCLHRRSKCLLPADANALMNAPSRPSPRITSSSSRAWETA